MTNKEKIKKDIATAFDFAEKIVNEPEVLDQLTNDSTIHFIESGEEKKELKTEKRNRKYVRVKHQFDVL
jgi:hypothetical protein